MKRIALLLFLFASVHSLCGQRASSLFKKTWGAPLGSVIVYADELPNGDYVLIGYGASGQTNQSLYDHYIYMCRMDKTGAMLWEQKYGGTPGNDAGVSSVIKTKQGTYLIAGTTYRISYDIHVLHLDASGTVLFDTYCSENYLDYANSICETPDSCFMVACGVNALSLTDIEPMLIKLDAHGNELWRKRQDSLLNYNPQIIRPLPDSTYIVCGKSSHFGNMYFAKYKPDGNLLWIRYPYGTNDTSVTTTLTGMFINPDGTFDMTCTESVQSPFSTSTHWKSFNASGTQTNDYILPIGVGFCHLFNFGPPSYDAQNDMYVSTAPPNANCASWVTEIDKNKTVHYRAKLNDADSAYVSLLYSIHTQDGGYFSVGTIQMPNEFSRFFAVKFGADGRYEPESFSATVNAYPNPVTAGIVTLSFDMPSDDNVQIQIFSSDGKLVLTDEVFCPANTHIELPMRLPETAEQGIYVIEARTSSAMYRKKIFMLHRN